MFDLDGTLAISKSRIDGEMAALLERLLAVVQVAIISGGDWPQFEQQLLGGLSGGDSSKRLHLLPTCGTKFFEYRSTWDMLYSEDLTDREKAKITDALIQTAQALGLAVEEPWGQIIEDRGSQITFSALGQDAPIEEKRWWDPDFVKRKSMKESLDRLIPEFSVRLGGTTSVDITKRGIDKAHGIRKLHEILGIELAEMLFIGDALFPGGNDYPVREAGVDSIQVRDPDETKRVIEAIMACVDGVGFAMTTVMIAEA